MKLEVGNIIEVHGWVMLKNLEGGNKYKVTRVDKVHGRNAYFFSKARGKKEVVGHYINNVDMMINPSNNNRIEIIK